MKTPVSILILTYNEAPILGRCLASVAWSDDIVVFDSYSTDATVAIARAAGARVVQRPFDNYGAQREAARVWGKYRHQWVLALDADEQMDTELVGEIQSIAAGEAGGSPSAYRMRRKDYFRGRWLRHSTLYPSWFIRLYQPQRIRYGPRAVHEYPIVYGQIGDLKGHLVHDSFSKGDEAWWEKHKRYAKWEAHESVKSLATRALDLKQLVSRDPMGRRRALKELSVRLPCRPILRFIYMYFLRGGFLDGLPGFEYCRRLARYERMIGIHVKEIRTGSRIVRGARASWAGTETNTVS